MIDVKDARSSSRNRTSTPGLCCLILSMAASAFFALRAAIKISEGWCFDRAGADCLPRPVLPPMMRMTLGRDVSIGIEGTDVSDNEGVMYWCIQQGKVERLGKEVNIRCW